MNVDTKKLHSCCTNLNIQYAILNKNKKVILVFLQGCKKCTQPTTTLQVRSNNK